ncbi:NUDIX domain-containing protein [Flagellimonas hymeniacidonis]|uniref:NUDIX domain-containing protein n=1 Tax=Flagellimonas hymeniacidonis TaxID=2603628 RepID=A0A5C8V2U8_9FLAO|nr:NUDIX domain-containing protein [Flagellimonas hymeniacidonis]TXN35412.1 NUDIX domain-containing protein [Flagellimonas hymeniacidonis]
MDELVDILDENGNYTGKVCLKSEAHLKGLFHPTVHIWFYTSEGKILFQQRGKGKKTFPLLWDVSVAGHIEAGETFQQAALREVAEEIGIPITKSDLKPIGVFKSMQEHSETLKDNEFHHVFLCGLNVPMSNLKKQESEVEELALIGLSEFKSKVDVKQLDGFVPHSVAYYHHIITEIEKIL